MHRVTARAILGGLGGVDGAPSGGEGGLQHKVLCPPPPPGRQHTAMENPGCLDGGGLPQRGLPFGSAAATCVL